jgi:hypothetical protein
MMPRFLFRELCCFSEEPTGDIVEVDRYPIKGTVKLQRKDGVWRYAGTEKLEK